MTEDEWLACANPGPLARRVAVVSSERKLRLLAVALHRRVIGEPLAGPVRRAVILAERFADGLTSASRLRAAELATRVEMLSGDWMTTAAGSAYTVTLNPFDAARAEMHHQMLRIDTDTKIASVVVELVRDIFGNPFHPITFLPEWRTSTVLTLARTMYDARHFSAMPILADALQDAGCDNEDILTHCREPGLHVRGCWVVDLVLSKE
jgi:hypothetical protein